MNVDKAFEGITAGLPSPSISLYQVHVPDEHIQSTGVRRKNAGATHHQLWLLAVAWNDGNPQGVNFYDHKPNGAIKKAMAWRGMPTIKRGPRAAKNGAAHASPAA